MTPSDAGLLDIMTYPRYRQLLRLTLALLLVLLQSVSAVAHLHPEVGAANNEASVAVTAVEESDSLGASASSAERECCFDACSAMLPTCPPSLARFPVALPNQEATAPTPAARRFIYRPPRLA